MAEVFWELLERFQSDNNDICDNKKETKITTQYYTQ